jgi:flavodoxin
MNIKIDVNEARILKMAMEGLSSANIEKQMADEIKTRVMASIRERMYNMVDHLKMHRDVDEAMKDAVVKNIADQVLKILTPTNIAKEFKREDWERLFENVVSPVVTNFFEHAMNEWLSMSIEIKGGKKKKSVELCGIDSYTYRKK